MKIEATKKGQRLADKALERIIIHPRELKKKYSTLLPALKKDKERFNTGFMAHAILTRACEKKKISKKESKLFSDYYLKLAIKAVKTENENFQTTILEQLEIMDKAILRLKKRNKDDALGELRLSLLRIQKALLQRDTKFFKANGL